jgi:hypothetical protein
MDAIDESECFYFSQSILDPIYARLLESYQNMLTEKHYFVESSQDCD